jgi:hypothetical protein
MKANLLLRTAIGLMLTGSFYSCENNGEITDGDVPYKPCLCDEEKPISGKSQGEAYLFKDFISEEMYHQMNKENSDAPSRGVCSIVFDSATGSAELFIRQGNMQSIGEICNFPVFALEWNIPQNGCKVYWVGIVYESCVPKGGIATATYFDFILTNLKRR